MHGRLLASLECVHHVIHVPVERKIKIPVAVIEITGLPNFGRLRTSSIKRVTPHSVFDEDAAFCAVDFYAVRVGIGVGGIIRTNQTAYRSEEHTSELQSLRHLV